MGAANADAVLIATWNVNSLRARNDLVLDWLARVSPDIVCLQETKVVDAAFPTEGFQRLGYGIAMAGQKTYNGVAILARHPITDVRIGLVDADPNDDKRLIAATIAGVRVYSAYVPNGKALDSPSFAEKLTWLGRLRATLDADPEARAAGELVVGGDYNIAPDERDVHDVDAMRGQLHFHPEEHAALDRLKAFGLRDALRVVEPGSALYSWWDYRAGAFRRNRGLRIDALLMTESLSSRLERVYMDVDERRRPKPSDHVPVVAVLRDH